METILIIGTFESIFIFLLIMGKKNKATGDFALALIFINYALSIGLTWLEMENANTGFPFPLFINISWLVLFLHGPAIWLYVKSLTEPHFKLKATHLLHLMPFVFFIIFHYFEFIGLSVSEKTALIENDLFKNKLSYKISVMAIGLITTAYNLWALVLIRRFRRNLKMNYSNIENIDLNWLRMLVIASVIIFFINSSLFVIDLAFHFGTYRYLMLLSFSFASVYVFILGYFGLQQGNIFVNKSLPVEKQPLTTSVSRPEAKEQDFLHVLSIFMEKNQPYLDPELTIARLGDLLQVKAEYLSEVLNQQLSQNFFDFINRYRVEEFKIQALVKKNKHLSIMGLAYSCGFNSKASFYRAFKKFEGITPSDYISASHKK